VPPSAPGATDNSADDDDDDTSGCPTLTSDTDEDGNRSDGGDSDRQYHADLSWNSAMCAHLLCVYVDNILFVNLPLDLSENTAASMVSMSKAMFVFLMWHQRLNHIGYQRLWNLISQGLLTGFPQNISLVDLSLIPACKTCRRVGMHHTIQPTANTPAALCTGPGQLIGIDLKKFSIMFFGEVNTMVVLLDYISNKRFIYWIKIPTNGEKDVFLLKIFKEFYFGTLLPRHFAHPTLRPDNASFFNKISFGLTLTRSV
jgi:hypothetical protein